jgi:hypothetical protein
LSVLDVQSFSEADCDNDNYLILANIREGLEVSKQRLHTFQMERFNLKKLNEVGKKKIFCVWVSNKLTTN